MDKPPKFIQIVCGYNKSAYDGHELYALDEEGNVFIYQAGGWKTLNMNRIGENPSGSDV